MMLTDKISFFKVCFDSMQMGILVCDQTNKIVLANNPISNIFGYTNEELNNINICLLFNDCNILKNYIKNPLSKKYKYGIETIGIKKNKSKFSIELSFGKIEYEGNIYFKIIISDISKRKKKETKIANLNVQLEEDVKIRSAELIKVIDKLKISLNKEKELNQLKTKFIELTSHEFKTPLSAILSSTELMAKYGDLNLIEKRDAHLVKIKSMIHHLNNMLDGLLTLENIESGKINTNFSKINLNNLISSLFENVKPFLKSSQQLIFENNGNEIIYHDSKILTIILTNLLYNAIKYSNENDTIKVLITVDKLNIFFKVIDNGIGIPTNEQNLIFNRFFRAKNAMYYPGTGIGLNIVKGYVNSLNGEINFESAENKGTTFIIQLPKVNNFD